MALCQWCGLDMLTADGCTLATYDDLGDGQVYPRRPFSLTIRGASNLLIRGDETRNLRCHDCRAILGRLHHPGCDAERCPKCGEQAIGCACCRSCGGDRFDCDCDELEARD